MQNINTKVDNLPPDVFDELNEEEVKNISQKYFDELLKPQLDSPTTFREGGISEAPTSVPKMDAPITATEDITDGMLLSVMNIE